MFPQQETFSRFIFKTINVRLLFQFSSAFLSSLYFEKKNVLTIVNKYKNFPKTIKIKNVRRMSLLKLVNEDREADHNIINKIDYSKLYKMQGCQNDLE